MQKLIQGTVFATPSLRKGIAACAVVLSAGGLILLRSPSVAGGRPNPLLDSPTSSGSSFAGRGLHGNVRLSQAKGLSGESVYANVQLVADERAGSFERAPLSLALVLDTSGSMSGEKIEEGRRSLLRTISNMRDSDELALIHYSDSATVLQPLARLGDVRTRVIGLIEGLSASGGTNIPSGLRSAQSALREARASNVRRIVLVSDGLDNSRSNAENIASELSEQGVTTSTLGIGLDFNEGYMASVANRGHGNFAFAKDGAAVATFLDRELRETAATVVDNTTISFRVPEGMEFVRARGAEARSTGSDVVLRVGSLFAKDERHILLEFRPTGSRSASFDFNVAWRVAGETSSESAKATGLNFAVVSDKFAADASRDHETYARALSVLATERQIQASEEFAKGNNERGMDLIRQNRLSLAAAASALPPAAAAPLRAQSNAYAKDEEGFGAGGAAKGLGKVMMMRESGNAARKATY
jgi:Ca-activated chloride channel homolog